MAWSYARVAAAALTFAAIIAQLIRTTERALEATTDYASHVPTVVANFLSYFTIQSNLFTAILLVVAAVWAWTKGKDAETEPRWLAILLACLTTYMIVTGIVYNTLLRNVVLDQGVTVWWSNEILHVVIPVFMLVDLFVAPKRRPLPWSTVGIIAIYPIVWAVYTLLRADMIIAPASGNPWWYPYPFLDPHLVPGGYVGVAGYIVGIAIAIVGVGLLVVWVGRWRAQRRVAVEAAVS
ncbi:hypothetical protein ASD65_12335 [Microbacterium sp. Root61]|uniref:Pr6Pr family membrane protein n=1 Tax=Microbacterium sp. Root61 TaxID=1736570 RepID=UPI0006F34DA4|nr:Pr6Pr family membrane protein [Microbacterium sp. Root61]KRA25125.1 hypothetical protein ASD65_12335 [Microbacterium sp. Root61]